MVGGVGSNPLMNPMSIQRTMTQGAKAIGRAKQSNSVARAKTTAPAKQTHKANNASRLFAQNRAKAIQQRKTIESPTEVIGKASSALDKLKADTGVDIKLKVEDKSTTFGKSLLKSFTSFLGKVATTLISGFKIASMALVGVAATVGMILTGGEISPTDVKDAVVGTNKFFNEVKEDVQKFFAGEDGQEVSDSAADASGTIIHDGLGMTADSLGMNQIGKEWKPGGVGGEGELAMQMGMTSAVMGGVDGVDGILDGVGEISDGMDIANRGAALKRQATEQMQTLHDSGGLAAISKELVNQQKTGAFIEVLGNEKQSQGIRDTLKATGDTLNSANGIINLMAGSDSAKHLFQNADLAGTTTQIVGAGFTAVTKGIECGIETARAYNADKNVQNCDAFLAKTDGIAVDGKVSMDDKKIDAAVKQFGEKQSTSRNMSTFKAVAAGLMAVAGIAVIVATVAVGACTPVGWIIGGAALIGAAGCGIKMAYDGLREKAQVKGVNDAIKEIDDKLAETPPPSDDVKVALNEARDELVLAKIQLDPTAATEALVDIASRDGKGGIGGPGDPSSANGRASDALKSVFKIQPKFLKVKMENGQKVPREDAEGHKLAVGKLTEKLGQYYTNVLGDDYTSQGVDDYVSRQKFT